MPLYARKDVILAKTEVTYATDPVPTGAANAILVSNLTMTPMEQTLVPRDLIRAFFGNSDQLPAQIYGIVEFDVEMQSSGTAGTAPKFGPLLEACGMVETLVAVTRAEYSPTSTDSLMESVTIYGYKDGVLHKLTGARGSVSLSMPNQGIPKLRFRFFGIFNTVTDASPTGVSYTGFVKPVVCNATNTTPFTLHSISPVVASLEIDLSNNLVYRDYIGGSKQVLITNREPKGRIEMEAPLMATKNWFTSVLNASTAPLAVTHGLSAGNICKVDAPLVQVVSPTYSESDGITMLAADLMILPNTGNDELKLTFQ
jgi:hypothetical protein